MAYVLIKDRPSLTWMDDLNGWLAPDAYSTAWVALVPDVSNPERPAWPDALDYLRSNQLEDGGWGDPEIYYAHERTITSLAAVRALHTWQKSEADKEQIKAGLRALRRYAPDLANEPHEPVGFELILPRLRDALAPLYADELPLEHWAPIEALNREKLALIQKLQPDPAKQNAWWVSMEMLTERQLALLDDSLLDENGSIATSTAATAAYLWARRCAGADSPRAAGFLHTIIEMGQGSVPFCWPVEVFERVWALDNIRRAGFGPRELPVTEFIDSIEQSWYQNDPGLSSSELFLVNDGDDTLVGFTVLNWAERAPSEEPMLAFWNDNHFRSYLDERTASVSANIHGLTALRTQPGFPHRDMAGRLTAWLESHIRSDGSFDDKWHFSPYYSMAHAMSAFAGWDDAIARHCMKFIVDHQRSDGGWGWSGRSTLEESAHCVIALGEAARLGLLEDSEPLFWAARFLEVNKDVPPAERFWIGKTLFRPERVVESVLHAAHAMLQQLGLTI